MTQKLHSRYILRRNGNVYLCKHPYINIHSNIIHNSQKVEITQMPWWTGKKKCVIFTQYSVAAAAAAAKWLQSCPTLCDPIDSSPPGSPVPGILQARTLECCHFLLQRMKVKSESEVCQSCPTLRDPMDCSLSGSSVHGIFPGKSTGVGSV